MDTLSYILGSGISDHPYVIAVVAMLVMACILALFACNILEKGNEKRRYLVYILAILSLALFVSSLYLLTEGEKEMKKEHPPVEENDGKEMYEYNDDVNYQPVTHNMIYHGKLQPIE